MSLGEKECVLERELWEVKMADANMGILEMLLGFGEKKSLLDSLAEERNGYVRDKKTGEIIYEEKGTKLFNKKYPVYDATFLNNVFAELKTKKSRLEEGEDVDWNEEEEDLYNKLDWLKTMEGIKIPGKTGEIGDIAELNRNEIGFSYGRGAYTDSVEAALADTISAEIATPPDMKEINELIRRAEEE